MKIKIYSLIALALTGVTINYACKDAQSGSTGKGIVLTDIDSTVKPGDNFFYFATGGWSKANPIPGDETRWGTFNELNQNNKENLRKILEEASAVKDAKIGTSQQLISDFYYSAMDTTTIEKLGATPLKADMDAIDAVKSVDELLAVVAAMHRNGDAPLFSFYAYQDPKNSEVVVPQIYQGGLSLPDRDYYLKDDERSKEIRAEYNKHIINMFKLYGADEATAAKYSQAVFAIEKDLASNSMTRVEQRDPFKTYNKVTIEDLNKLTPNINWLAMMNNIGAKTGFDYLVLGQPKFLTTINAKLQTTSLEDWKVYLKWHLLSGSASLLSNDFVMENFHFNNQVIRGQKEIKPRWKRMTDLSDNLLGDALGQLYVAKYFPPDAKKKAEVLVDNLMAAYKERLQKLDWMSDATKSKALEKLSTIIRKIGYPDKWKDYANLQISRETLYQNVKNASTWGFDFMLNKIGKPVDKTEWIMTPATVNAYYNPSVNEIVFPAGILQPPFFNAQADDAVNYGAIGMVIGHEVTHGFDDEGRNYDSKGNLNSWWTSEDSAKFVAKAKVVVEQYNAYTVLDSLHVNGELTLGENLADLGGLYIAYEAFKMTDQGRKEDKIDGFTPDQRFFLGFARVWAGSILPKEAANRILTDPHSPAQYRVNGPLSNMDAFYKAFGIKEGDKMFKPEAQRAKIW